MSTLHGFLQRFWTSVQGEFDRAPSAYVMILLPIILGPLTFLLRSMRLLRPSLPPFVHVIDPRRRAKWIGNDSGIMQKIDEFGRAPRDKAWQPGQTLYVYSGTKKRLCSATLNLRTNNEFDPVYVPVAAITR